MAKADWDGPNWWGRGGRAPSPTSPRRTAGKPTLPATRGMPRTTSPAPARLVAPSRSSLASIVTPQLVAGFAIGLFGVLVVAGAVALAVSWANGGRVMPNVHVGSVDISGLTREEAISRLDSAYAYLGQGKVVVTTPAGPATVTYA